VLLQTLLLGFDIPISVLKTVFFFLLGGGIGLSHSGAAEECFSVICLSHSGAAKDFFSGIRLSHSGAEI
jgi:hypothetical protein